MTHCDSLISIWLKTHAKWSVEHVNARGSRKRTAFGAKPNAQYAPRIVHENATTRDYRRSQFVAYDASSTNGCSAGV